MRDTDQDWLERLVTTMRDRTLDYEAKPPRPKDWSAYTKAQVNEISDTLNLIRRLVDQAPEPPPYKGPGRPPEYHSKDLAKTLFLQQYLETSNRVTQGWAELFQEKLGLAKAPHYKAIERAYDNSDVVNAIKHARTQTAQLDADHIEGFTLDGSALPNTSKVNWESEKDTKRAKKENYDGAVTMLTVPHMIVTAFVPHPVGWGSESPTLEPLVHQTLSTLGSLRGIVSADAAFLSRKNCQLISDHGGTPRIYPKRGISPRAHGHPAWRKMLLDLLRDPQAWLHEYHDRSLSESHWSRDKRRNTKPLRRRAAYRRATERTLRVTTGNVTRIAALQRMGELRPMTPAG